MRRLVLLVSGTAVAIVAVVALRTHAGHAPHHPPGRPSPTVRVALPSPSATRHVYHSGVATGALARTDYGAVQVRVTVVHGRIVKVAALRLPQGNQMDVRLSKPAARVLEQRVISAQSADVDMVSGATYTSEGYLRSLQSALDRL
jgi:uncharacterized protein with FMN-binding domain